MKLIVSDMDGTLLDSKGCIPEENISAIREAEILGIEIAIATGRMYRNAREICTSAGLTPHIISNNGAFIYTKEKQRLLSTHIDPATAQNALAWLDRHGYFYFACSDTESYMPGDAEERITREYSESSGRIRDITGEQIEGLLTSIRTGTERIYDLREFAGTKELGSISAICSDLKKLEEGKNRFRNRQEITMTAGGNHVFELLHPSASKGNALKILANHLGIRPEEAMAIGDHDNDLSMFAEAGISVAMGNAHAGVKQHCTRQTLSNDLHGVAHAIRAVLHERIEQRR
jgi:Cof subfamily protein (haloacid dehalogenase superfamily)